MPVNCVNTNNYSYRGTKRKLERNRSQSKRKMKKEMVSYKNQEKIINYKAIDFH